MNLELAVQGGMRGVLARETVSFRGHPNVRSLHPTTVEVTTDETLSVKGDCIIGVAADRGCLGLSKTTKVALRTPGARVVLSFEVGGTAFAIQAEGHPDLLLSHPTDMVVRKSEFISDRTLAIRADASARDLPRNIVTELKDTTAVGRMVIEVRV